MIRVVITLAMLLPLGAHAQRQISTWQELGGYVGEQTTKLNELQAKLRFQQGLIDAQAAQITALKAHTALQAVWIADSACKWNKLVEQLSKGQLSDWNRITPVGQPPVAYQPPGERTACDGTSPPPVWPDPVP